MEPQPDVAMLGGERAALGPEGHRRAALLRRQADVHLEGLPAQVPERGAVVEVQVEGAVGRARDRVEIEVERLGRRLADPLAHRPLGQDGVGAAQERHPAERRLALHGAWTGEELPGAEVHPAAAREIDGPRGRARGADGRDEQIGADEELVAERGDRRVVRIGEHERAQGRHSAGARLVHERVEERQQAVAELDERAADLLHVRAERA